MIISSIYYWITKTLRSSTLIDTIIYANLVGLLARKWKNDQMCCISKQYVWQKLPVKVNPKFISLVPMDAICNLENFTTNLLIRLKKHRLIANHDLSLGFSYNNYNGKGYKETVFHLKWIYHWSLFVENNRLGKTVTKLIKAVFIIKITFKAYILYLVKIKKYFMLLCVNNVYIAKIIAKITE